MNVCKFMLRGTSCDIIFGLSQYDQFSMLSYMSINNTVVWFPVWKVVMMAWCSFWASSILFCSKENTFYELSHFPTFGEWVVDTLLPYLRVAVSHSFTDWQELFCWTQLSMWLHTLSPANRHSFSSWNSVFFFRIWGDGQSTEILQSWVVYEYFFQRMKLCLWLTRELKNFSQKSD
jgi:hypothetical protein